MPCPVETGMPRRCCLPRRRSHGYTLLEMAVVLAIVAMVAGGVMTITAAKVDTDRYAATNAELDAIEAAIQNYAYTLGYEPCPTVINLAPDSGSAGYGISGTCLSGEPGSGTNFYDTGAGVDVVRIGAVPVRTLNLPDSDMYDAWGNQFTYMVVRALARNTTPPPLLSTAGTPNFTTAATTGEILVQDGAGNQIVDAIGGSNQPIVAYAIISHGRTAIGAVPRGGGYVSGTSKRANGTTWALPCTGYRDSENCDLNAIIIDQRYTDSKVLTQFFDDLVRWKLKTALVP